MKTSSARQTRDEQLFVQQTIKLINRQRRLHGMRGLKWDRELTLAARDRAKDMAKYQYMEHVEHNGQQWYQIVEYFEKKLGHLGENIAHGFDDPRTLVQAWMNSPEHRKNILDRKFRYAGMATAHAINGDNYTAHDFGG